MSDWHTLQRHPISAEYADIRGPEWFGFTLGMKRHGFLSDRKIVLHEGMVLDGWQRLRCCIETNTEPEFTTLPAGVDPRAYVGLVNDHRRHETSQEKTDRIKRVTARRKKGESFRTIAEAEKVSVGQVQRDLKDGVYPGGGTPSPESGKVVGRDGLTYPASTKPRCERCQRIYPAPSTTMIDGCTACADLRASQPRKKAKPGKRKPAAPQTRQNDDAGILVPMRLNGVFGCRALFLEAARALVTASAAMKAAQASELGKAIKPGKGESFEKWEIPIRRASEWIRKHSKLLLCRKCQGDGCEHCGDLGFTFKEGLP